MCLALAPYHRYARFPLNRLDMPCQASTRLALALNHPNTPVQTSTCFSLALRYLTHLVKSRNSSPRIAKPHHGDLRLRRPYNKLIVSLRHLPSAVQHIKVSYDSPHATILPYGNPKVLYDTFTHPALPCDTPHATFLPYCHPKVP